MSPSPLPRVSWVTKYVTFHLEFSDSFFIPPAMPRSHLHHHQAIGTACFPALPFPSQVFSATTPTLTVRTGTLPCRALKHQARWRFTLCNLVNSSAIRSLLTFLHRHPVTFVHTSRKYMSAFEPDEHRVLADSSARRVFSGPQQGGVSAFLFSSLRPPYLFLCSV